MTDSSDTGLKQKIQIPALTFVCVFAIAYSVFVVWSIDHVGEWTEWTAVAFSGGLLAAVGGIGLSLVFHEVVEL